MNAKLLSYVKEKNSIWIGDNAPFNMNAVSINTSTNYRLSKFHHNSYKIVWFFEYLLSDIYAWKNILDELIRLIDNNGTIVLRIQENNILDANKLNFFLKKSILIQDVLIKEENQRNNSKKDNEKVFIIDFKRKNFEIYKDSSWTFILFNDNKEYLTKFCENVRKYEKSNTQIILISPNNDSNYCDLDIVKINSDKKKTNISNNNELFDCVKNENIMVIKEDFNINKDFFEGFEIYGYDFDYITTRQNYKNGIVYHSYLKRKEMDTKNLYYINSERFADDNLFIRNNLFIIKKKTFLELELDFFLDFDENNCIESSDVIRKKSVIPRLNLYSSCCFEYSNINKKYVYKLDPIEVYEQERDSTLTAKDLCSKITILLPLRLIKLIKYILIKYNNFNNIYLFEQKKHTYYRIKQIVPRGIKNMIKRFIEK